MYLRGMGDYYDVAAEEDQYWGEQIRAQTYPSLPVAESNSPGYFDDWSGALTTAIKTWGQVETSKQQAKVMEAQAQRNQSLYYPGALPASYRQPGALYPFTSGAGSASLFGIPVEWLLIGAAGIAALILTSK